MSLNDQLSDRDVAVLSATRDHRFLTTQQLHTLLFHDHASDEAGGRACRRVLSRLERCQLLERPIRRIGGLQAGSAASVWMISSRGLRLLNLRAGLGAVGRVREPGERFVRHYLAIADAHLALIEADRQGRLELLEVRIEPSCWRSFAGLSGQLNVLKPDLTAITAVVPEGGGRAEFEDHWFIEIDRGTESLPTLLRQCQLYETYRVQGREQLDHGVFPLCVWVVPDEGRAAKLGAALRAARHLTTDLYRVTTPEGFLDLILDGAAS